MKVFRPHLERRKIEGEFEIAGMRWTPVPLFHGEMPVLGFLGFPPFAIECWAIYIFVRSLLQPAKRDTGEAEIFMRAG